MITLNEASKQALMRGIARAEKEHLTARLGEVNLDGGAYYVTSSNGLRTYFVTIVPKGNGAYESECTCEAGRPTTGDRIPLICKHVSLALSLYKGFEFRARHAGIITVCDCGNTIPASAQYCDDCIYMMHEAQLEAIMSSGEVR